MTCSHLFKYAILNSRRRILKLEKIAVSLSKRESCYDELNFYCRIVTQMFQFEAYAHITGIGWNVVYL